MGKTNLVWVFPRETLLLLHRSVIDWIINMIENVEEKVLAIIFAITVIGFTIEDIPSLVVFINSVNFRKANKRHKFETQQYPPPAQTISK